MELVFAIYFKFINVMLSLPNGSMKLYQLGETEILKRLQIVCTFAIYIVFDLYLDYFAKLPYFYLYFGLTFILYT